MIARVLHHHSTLVLGLALGLSQMPTASLNAQLSCVRPALGAGGMCQAATVESREVIAVRLTDAGGNPAAGASIYFTKNNGKIDSAKTGADGVATAIWQGFGPATIVAHSALGGMPANLVIEFAGGTPIRLTPVARALKRWPDVRTWYEKKQLDAPFTATFVRPQGVLCDRIPVVFAARGTAAVTEDTVFSKVNGANCEASTSWRLGDGVGTQVLRATVMDNPEPPAIFKADSRSLPWFGIGLAINHSPKFPHLDMKRSAIQVDRRFRNAVGDSVTISYDSSASRSAVDTLSRYSASPLIGIDFPLLLAFERFRFSVAADLTNPTHDWFLGLSVLQLGGFRHEDIGFDLAVGSHFGKRDVLENPTECATGAASCLVKTKAYSAMSALLLINGVSVLDKLLPALGVGK